MARFALLVAVMAAFLITIATAIILVPLLGKWNLERSLHRFDGARSPQAPKGVPTMGGLCIAVGMTFGIALAWVGLRTIEPQLADGHQRYLLSLSLCTTLAFGVIGLADDMLRLAGNGRGLRRGTRLVLQAVVVAAFLVGLRVGGALDTGMVIPSLGYLDLGFWYYPCSYALILFFVNAVDCTDGPDGLCTCLTFVAAAGMLMMYGMLNYFQLAIFPAAMAGALLAFSLWNFAPARVQLGHTGGMLLGGALCAAAYSIGWPGLLLLLGGVFVLEAFSLLAQIVVFKLGKGRKLLPAAPLHCALKACGWSDAKVIGALCAAGAVFVLLAVLFVRVSR